MDNAAIPLGALIVALASLVLSGLAQRRGVTADTIADLRAEIAQLTEHARLCDDRYDTIVRENRSLMAELIDVRRENGRLRGNDHN